MNQMDNGVPSIAEYDARYAEAQAKLRSVQGLVAKARALVALLEDAETNHGGLIGTKTLRAKNELRLELSKWV